MQDACPWYKTYVLVRGETNKWFADISIVSELILKIQESVESTASTKPRLEMPV